MNGPFPVTRTATAGKHPAQFTDSIIEFLAELLPEVVPPGWGVHDPFAGVGTRLGALCDRYGYGFTGTELEEWNDQDHRIAIGDSTDPTTYPPGTFVVVTSPTYNNGVNDHFEPKDGSTRLTYRSRLGRALHPNNTGRYSGRGSKKGEAEYWRLTREVVKNWPDVCVVNVKDSPRLNALYPFTQLWTDLLVEHDYAVERHDVACPGWRFGTNGQARADTEAILVARRGSSGWTPSVEGTS